MGGETRNFDQEAATWDENPARLKLAGDVFAAIQDRIPVDETMCVLDFGCGTGLVTLQFAPVAGSVTGLDSSQGMLDVLAEKIVRQGLTNVRAQRIDPDGGGLTGLYDIIVSNMTFHHVEHIAPLLRRFHESLRPGGYLCISDLDSDGGLFHTDKTGVFHSGFDRTELRDLFAQAGFANVGDTTAAEVTRPGADGQMRRFTIFLMTGRRK